MAVRATEQNTIEITTTGVLTYKKLPPNYPYNKITMKLTIADGNVLGKY